MPPPAPPLVSAFSSLPLTALHSAPLGRLALEMASEAVSGPAYGPDMPPFQWSKFKDVAHRGMIAKYDTTFELQKP